MKTNPNDYAHSNGQKDPNNDGFIINGGLTKLEYFAAMAMQGQVACASFSQDVLESNGYTSTGCGIRDTAKAAVLQAKALIAELNKEQ